MESIGSYWKPVFNILEDHVEVVLANAFDVRNRRGHKEKTLEDSNVKLDDALTDVFGLSGRLVVKALLDLDDFVWKAEGKLMCPNNPIGTVDIYQTVHHGSDRSGSPVLVHALHRLASS